MPIHFLWGDEDFLIEKAANKIKKEILGADVNELNYRAVDNPSFSLFSELIRTNAMMFGDIVIQVKCQKYFLEIKSKEKLDDKQVMELVSGLNNVSDRVHLILICPTPRGEKKKPDSRKKLYKELIKLTTPQEFPSYRSYEEYKLIPIIKKMASEIELKINDGEASLLIQTVGSSLRDISVQLEKLKLYAHPENLVTTQMIKDVVSSNSDIFNLVDLILAKNWTKTINLLNEILQKEHFLPSLAFLQTSITNMLKIKLYAGSMSTFDLAIKLNQNEFVLKKNIEKLTQVSLDDLVNLKINLATAEYNLKSGTIKDPLTAYELAFFGGKKC
ncbi:MAG: DNA polymerase III subunit delta [Candidatus Gastranaerophilales bacterium]|nr:DNA polymerase III subunit delta [Candidatus Gastranaerophilales bacterium]